MTTRVELRYAWLASFFVWTAGFSCNFFAWAQAEDAKPNIVIIMADDMGYGDLTCYNAASKISTPHIDRLAHDGMRFTDAHSPSAVCTPTRYGLLTGRYCWRTRLKRGVFGGYGHPLIEPNRITIASLLKRHGYATGCFGKWHVGMDWTLKEGTAWEDQDQWTVDYSQRIVGGPLQVGFDTFFGTSGCTTDDPPFCFIHDDRTVGIPNVVASEDPADEDRKLLMVPGWRHEDADIEFVRRAAEFIETQTRERPEQPFFVYLPLSVPHIPWLPPDLVKGKSDAGPRGDQVVLVDWAVEQISETLERLQLTNRTLLVVTSDNGPREGVNGHRSAGDWRGLKGSIWEGGHRVPFIARWPGKIPSGTTSDEVVCLTDLLATSAAVIGAELPDDAGEDSFNLLTALMREQLDEPIRPAIVHHSGGGVFAIRQGPWKLIIGTQGSGQDLGPRDSQPGQLYNLAGDPGERRNRWDQEPEIVRRLSALLNRYQMEGHSRPAPDRNANQLLEGTIRCHDPSPIVRTDGILMTFATGRGIPTLYRSIDDERWKVGRPVFRRGQEPSWIPDVLPGYKGFWAPHALSSRVVYYSVANDDHGKDLGCIGRATAVGEPPNLRWVDDGRPVLVCDRNPRDEPFAIDPAVFSGADDTLWLVYGSHWSGIWVVELDPETGHLKDRRAREEGWARDNRAFRQVAVNTDRLTDEILAEGFTAGQIEAPFVYRHRDHYYLFVNWGVCCQGINSTYEIRIGRSRHPQGPYLDKSGRDLADGGGSLFLATDGRFIGPGHAGIYASADGGATRHVFTHHFYDREEEGRAKLHARELAWSQDGWPVLTDRVFR